MNIVLEEEQYRDLKERAHRRRTSVSALLRDLIARDDDVPPNQSYAARTSVLDLIGVIDGRADDAARRHDEILYGRP